MQANVTELLVESATLLVVGMAVVFVFLTMLIGGIKVIAFINSRLPAEIADTPRAPLSRVPTKASTTTVNASTIAAISAAVHQYRKHHQ